MPKRAQCCVLLILLFVSLALTACAASATPVPTRAPVSEARIIYVANTDGDGVVLRSAPRMDARTEIIFAEGQPLVMSKHTAGWAYITSPTEGYIPPQYWSTSPPQTTATRHLTPITQQGVPVTPSALRTPEPAAHPLSVEIMSLTSPVSAGQQATLRARTIPGATGVIVVTYKSGPSNAKGLEPKLADTAGMLTWTWTIDARTPRGVWPIDVTVLFGGQSATTRLQITVN